MLTVKTTELELMQGWFDSDPEHTRVRVAFPINKWAGSRDSAVVYFEVKPGDRLARHTDSAEEILYVVAGEAEAEVGDAARTHRRGRPCRHPRHGSARPRQRGQRDGQGRGLLLGIRGHFDLQRASAAVRSGGSEPGRAAVRVSCLRRLGFCGDGPRQRAAV